MSALTSSELALLKAVRDSDEDHGGLAAEEIGPDEHPVMEKLCALGLVQTTSEFDEAPDGEEDEREAGRQLAIYRITGAGVGALGDAG